MDFWLPSAGGTANTGDSFDQLRQRYRALLDGGPHYDPADPDIQRRIRGHGGLDEIATANWNSLNTTPDCTFLWEDSPGNEKSDQITRSYERLKTMAQAHATRGSALYGNAELRRAIIESLDWLHANRYYIRPPYDNWFPWQIGIPLALNDIVMLMYEHLSAEQIGAWMAVVDYFAPEPKYTAANLIWLTIVVAERGIIVGDTAKVALARDGISPALEYVTSGDGFYRDGSFIQHGRLPYNGGYGIGLLGSLARLLYLLSDSEWQVSDPNLANVFRWVYDSFAPFMFRGAMMDMVRGREISRETSPDHVAGHGVIGAIAWISQAAPPEDAAAFQGMVKRWVLSDTYLSFFSRASVAQIVLVKSIIANAEMAPPPMFYRQFPAMDRAVAQRPGFALGISMSSSRIYNFETIEVLRENKRGWYTADGMTYLYNSDLGQFSGDFWATVDARRLPGITVDSARPRADFSGQLYLSPKQWVGGVALQGRYGLSGMELAAWESSLVARKSWFVFEDLIVALGSGISASDGKLIETIVENRKLGDSNADMLTIDGVVQPDGIPWSGTFLNPRWAHLAGSVAGANIGYYFPTFTALAVKREARTDSWFAINETFGSATPVTRNYLSLAANHGINPRSTSYTYALLPNRTSTEVAMFAEQPSFVVLECTEAAHAVKDMSQGLAGAAFWDNSPHTVVDENDVGFLTCSGVAAVMLQEAGGQLAVAIADPTQRAEGTIELMINRAAQAVRAAGSGVTVAQLSPQIVLRVEVGGSQGQTFSVLLDLA